MSFEFAIVFSCWCLDEMRLKITKLWDCKTQIEAALWLRNREAKRGFKIFSLNVCVSASAENYIPSFLLPKRFSFQYSQSAHQAQLKLLVCFLSSFKGDFWHFPSLFSRKLFPPWKSLTWWIIVQLGIELDTRSDTFLDFFLFCVI